MTTDTTTLPPLHPSDVKYARDNGRDYAAFHWELWVMFRAVCKAQTTTDRRVFTAARRRFDNALESCRRWSDYPYHTITAWESEIHRNDRRTMSPAQRAAWAPFA